MGIIRVILAFSVFVAHTSYSGKLGTGGLLAVQLFFVISGFYMTFILNNKYESNTLVFYKNRFFRLFPMYFFLLLLCILLYIFFDIKPWLGFSLIFEYDVNYKTLVFMLFSNLTLLFQDIAMFLRLENGAMQFGNFHDSVPLLYTFLFVPQAWSISLEICFYLIAPFIVKNPKRLLVVFIVSTLIRGYLLLIGKNLDPWTYRFFPAEMALFTMGALSFHFYKMKYFNIIQNNIKTILFFFICILILYNYLPITFGGNKRFIFYSIFAFLLPYFFYYSKNNKLDRNIGELSYPIYLCHLFALSLSTKIFIILKLKGMIIGAVLITILLSLFLTFIVQKPFNKIRNSYDELPRGKPRGIANRQILIYKERSKLRGIGPKEIKKI